MFQLLASVAAEMIAELTLAMEFGSSAEDIARTMSCSSYLTVKLLKKRQWQLIKDQFISNICLLKNMIKKAMILAAGFGKRIHPLTLKLSKTFIKNW